MHYGNESESNSEDLQKEENLEDKDSEADSLDIRARAKEISLQSLPEKSKRIYVATYNKFKQWRKDFLKDTKSFSEDVILIYMDELAKKYAPPTLCTIFAQLKSTINSIDQVDVSKYTRVIQFLRKKNVGYSSKVSEVFTKENIVEYLNDAPDEVHLFSKVCLILGITGGLRKMELYNLQVDHIQEIKDEALLVRIFQNKSNNPKSFVLEGVLCDFIRLYISLRPEDCTLPYLFLNFQEGRCTKQRVGINKIGNTPRNTARYLHLPNSEGFTGHGSRRTSATLMGEAGADEKLMKRHGPWKSGAVIEHYQAETMFSKKKIFNLIIDGMTKEKPKTSKPVYIKPPKCLLTKQSSDDGNIVLPEIINANSTLNNAKSAIPPHVPLFKQRLSIKNDVILKRPLIIEDSENTENCNPVQIRIKKSRSAKVSTSSNGIQRSIQSENLANISDTSDNSSSIAQKPEHTSASSIKPLLTSSPGQKIKATEGSNKFLSLIDEPSQSNTQDEITMEKSNSQSNHQSEINNKTFDSSKTLIESLLYDRLLVGSVFYDPHPDIGLYTLEPNNNFTFNSCQFHFNADLEDNSSL